MIKPGNYASVNLTKLRVGKSPVHKPHVKAIESIMREGKVFVHSVNGKVAECGISEYDVFMPSIQIPIDCLSN